MSVLQATCVRRGLVINLEALSEQPEKRDFKRDMVKEMHASRATYVATRR